MNAKYIPAWRLHLRLVVMFLTVNGCDHSLAQSPTLKPELTKDQFEQLLQPQPVVADSPIFSGDVFPKVDFRNKDLIQAALGAYSLTVRYFDSAWNEVQRPTNNGRYGAWIEIRFLNGTTDTRHLTLFKSSTPYKPRKDPFQLQVLYPTAFGISKEVLESERWNSQDFLNGVLNGAYHDDNDLAVLVAALHDLEADSEHWRGFNCWHIDDAWWTGLDKKLGNFQGYQRLVKIPDDYDKKPEEKWPLILFLHGSGERSDDLNKLTYQGPLGYINHGHPLPFVVVAPQCPRRGWWIPEKLNQLITEVEASYRIDPKRIYVTGLSMGGYGTFDLAACYPQRFAAIASLSGGENPEIAERLKTVPTWIFHGEDDDVVPARYSIDIAEAMKKLGADVKLTLYPGVGHGGWDKTYGDPALYDWFLHHSRP